MKEYRIIRGQDSECQKWLNQWKHEFAIEILGFQNYEEAGFDKVVILLTRVKK